jgi:hypothetical protein
LRTYLFIPAGTALSSTREVAQRPAFLGEEVFYLLIGETRCKQAHELSPSVASISVQGEQTAIFAADSTQASLELRVVILYVVTIAS